MRPRLVAILIAILLCQSSAAQVSGGGGGVHPSGSITSGDCAKWVNPWMLADAAAACGTTLTIASGTSALGTAAISSGTCATVVTTSATGAATTDVIGWGFNGDPTATTGYQASTNGMLTIVAYPTANNVNFKVCNNTASAVTPGAVTLNWRVTR